MPNAEYRQFPVVRMANASPPVTWATLSRAVSSLASLKAFPFASV